MKAICWMGVGDIRLTEVADPKIQEPTDAIVRLTASAICGTDLHFIRGTVPDMVPGTVLGHEGVGIVEEIGKDVRNLSVGDRVVIPSTIACGTCSYCRAGYYAQCDNANPNGADAGTAFFGGPKTSGPFNGLQAEKARIPYANVGLVKLPDEVTDDQAILISDIFPTGYFGADIAGIEPGDMVAVFGCGPVGQFVIASAKLMGAGRVFAVDRVPSRLEMARSQGAETINFEEEDPVETLLRLTGKIGVDRAIDAVGVDAQHAHHGRQAIARGEKRVRAGSRDHRAQNQSRWRQLDSRRRAFAGVDLGGEGFVQGRHAVDYRGLSRRRRELPDWPGHGQKSVDGNGQLQPPQIHPDAGRVGAHRRD